jgi:hypothetical protein
MPSVKTIGDAIFLCDVSGRMAQPWADAGYRCFCVDIQHSHTPRSDGNLHFRWGDVRTWKPPFGVKPVFVAAFPPCTHVANSGARHFALKGGQMLRDALETFEACHQAASWSGAPYCVENPKGVLSSMPHIGKPDHLFEPWHYTGYCPDDHYSKTTCLWVGNGFVMPKPFTSPRFDGVAPDDRIHSAPDSKTRADFRSATPRGFAEAVFRANAPHLTGAARA